MVSYEVKYIVPQEERILMRIVPFLALALFVLASCSDDKSISPTPPPSAAAKMGADVSFADRNLELLVRWALKKPEGRITSDELAALTHLDANKRLNAEEQPIRNLAGIQHCTGLDTLLLWGHQITDISPLAGLSELRRLNLGGNQVSDASPLAELTELRDLSLWGNSVADLRPLASLTKLEKLSLFGNGITDVEPLASLKKLKQLQLGNNEIEDVRPLNGLDELDWLGLVGNPIHQSQISQQLPALVKKDVEISVRTPGPSSPVATEPEPEPEPPEPEPEEVPGELPVDVSNLFVGDPWWFQFGNPEGLSVRSLPSWLSFDEATGRVEGTPTQAGRYEFVVDYGDGFTQRFLLIVADEAPHRDVQTYILGQSYGINLLDNPAAGVRPLAFTIEGDLPPGFSFDPEIAQIDGTPEATGTFDFDYVVTDANGEEVLRDRRRWVVITDPSSPQPEPEEVPLEEMHVSVDNAYVGVPWSTGYVASFSVRSLPSWLSFDESTGRIEGTPTQAGTYEFIVEFGDGSAERVLLIVEDEAPDRDVVETVILGRYYGTTLYPPEAGLGFTIEGDLPPGFSFDPESEPQLNGTPEATGTFDFDFVVTDASGEEVYRQRWRFVVITDPLLPPSTQPPESEEEIFDGTGTPYEYQVGVAAEFELWQPPTDQLVVHSIIGDLPDGLSFDEERVVITGTPTKAGTTDFIHRVEYGDVIAQGRLRVVVQEEFMAEPLIFVEGDPDFTFTVGVDVAVRLPRGDGGVPPLSYSLSGMLPPGLSFDPATREIKGIPTTPGAFEGTFVVTDAAGASAAVPLLIIIDPEPG